MDQTGPISKFSRGNVKGHKQKEQEKYILKILSFNSVKNQTTKKRSSTGEAKDAPKCSTLFGSTPPEDGTD